MITPGDDALSPQAPLDREAELDRLVRAVERARHHVMLVARTNTPASVQEITGELKRRVPSVRVIAADESTSGLAQLLRAEGPFFPDDVVCVTGLERAIPGGLEPKPSRFLAQTNLDRDALPRIHAGPVVLFLPEYAVHALRAQAPDFASVVTSTFWFEEELS